MTQPEPGATSGAANDRETRANDRETRANDRETRANDREAGVPPTSERDQEGGQEPRQQSIADALVSALAAAGPEAADHVVTAAQELRRAAETVLAAVTGALREHRTDAETPGPTTEAGDRGAESGQG